MTRRTKVPVLGNYKSRKLRKIRAAHGIPGLVDSRPIREHVTWLWEIGFTDGSIGAAAGLPQRSVWLVRNGTYSQTRIEHASRLKQVTHVPVPAQADLFVPAFGAARRIRALQALGYTYAHLSAELSLPKESFHRFTQVRQIQGRNWLRVAELYERLNATVGPSSLTATKARNRGFVTPMAWYGLDIDHPDQQPAIGTDSEVGDIDAILLERVLAGEYAGNVPAPERLAVLNIAVEKGWSGSHVARLLNLKKEAGDRALVRHRKKLRDQAAA